MFYQQGDVLFKRVKNIPEGAKRKHDPLLVEGEATGHHHSIATKAGWMVYMVGLEMYLRNKQEIEIKHQEHGPIMLPAGDWKIDQVKEYDHLREISRRVVD